MTRKTVQISEELHRQLKLKSVQLGTTIPAVIEAGLGQRPAEPVASTPKDGVGSGTAESGTKTTADDGSGITLEVPSEFWNQLTDDADGVELLLMGYKPTRGAETNEVIFTRDSETLTIPAEEGPRIPAEQVKEVIKLIEEDKSNGIDRRLEHAKSVLVRWRMLIRAQVRVMGLIKELEEGLQKRPAPEEYQKTYKKLQKLEDAMRKQDYATLKAKILESDPSWKEWSLPQKQNPSE